MPENVHFKVVYRNDVTCFNVTQTIVVVTAWYFLARLSLGEDDQSAFYLLDKTVLLKHKITVSVSYYWKCFKKTWRCLIFSFVVVVKIVPRVLWLREKTPFAVT